MRLLERVLVLQPTQIVYNSGVEKAIKMRHPKAHEKIKYKINVPRDTTCTWGMLNVDVPQHQYS